MEEPLLRAVANFWIPIRHVFHFNIMEISPTLEEFSAIIGEPKVSTLIFPTIGEHLFSFVQALLGVSLDTAWHWCMFDKLNIRSIFAYFSWLTVPVTSRPCYNYLNAFYLCILVRKQTL